MIMHSPLYSLKAWKGISSEAFSKMYHKEGSGVFRRRYSYTVAERWYRPTNPQTSLQQENRSLFQLAVSNWRTFSDAQKASWEYYQSYRKKRPVMSGYNLYISKFMLKGSEPSIPPSGRQEDYGSEDKGAMWFPYDFPFDFK